MRHESEEPLDDVFEALAITFADSRLSVKDRLQLAVEIAPKVIPGCDHAGVSIIHNDIPATVAASDETAERADALQYEARTGPCLEAAHLRMPINVADISEDPRYERFDAAAGEIGVHAALSVPLQVPGESTGSLNLYADRPWSYDQQSLVAARRFVEELDKALALISDIGAVVKQTTSPVTVMVVDDAADLRRLLVLLLEVDGTYERVIEAPDGAQAIAMAKEIKPDVIILDLEMPVMNGWEALPQLHALLPDARIVIFSSSEPIDEKALTDLGACGFVPKISGRAVLQQIKAAVSGHQT